ncbi:hypothetical protein GQ53DRAFT_880046 [Thozetella sp. PMI_491]|nr:hypothetical protein GQ53DRAFT_880046 [Thozetella sp. PMI_491]
MFANPAAAIGSIVGYLAVGAFASPTPWESDPAPKHRRGWLGGVDVDGACKIQYGDSWSADRNGGGCYDWVCKNGDDRENVNMNVACVSQYGVNKAYAGCGRTVWDWACYY